MSYGVFEELKKLKKKQEELKYQRTGQKQTATPIPEDTDYGVFKELRKIQQQQEDIRSALTVKSVKSTRGGSGGSIFEDDEDIAPVRKDKKEEEERTWFQKGAFDDGFSLKNTAKAIIGSAEDLIENVGTGIAGMGEKLVDSLAYIAPYIAQGQYYQNGGDFQSLEMQKQQNQVFEQSKADMSKFIQKDLYDEEKLVKQIYSNNTVSKRLLGENLDDISVFGEKSDALAQSAGQLAATAGLQAVGVPWYLTSGVTSFGGEVESGLNQGATMEEAGLSGLVTAGAEILTEKISGGIKFGGNTLDDALVKEIARVASNKTVSTLIKLGFDAAGEGFEEVLSGAISAVGQKLTYADDKELNELFSKEDAWEAFIGGAALGGGTSTINAVKSSKQGVDYASGLTTNEQKVVDKEYKDRVAEKEKDGKISQREKSKIYDQVLNDMERGDISTDSIEAALGGETYNNYRSTVASENNILKEFEELGKKQTPTLSETHRYNELAQQVKEIKEKKAGEQLKTKLSEEVKNLVQGDRLIESYNEIARREQAFEVDLNQYKDPNARKTVENFVGVVNNTNKAHAVVDFLAKVSKDTGQVFKAADAKKFGETALAIKRTKTLDADGTATEFSIGSTDISTEFKPVVTVNSQVVDNYTVDYKTGKITFDAAPTGEVKVEFRKNAIVNGNIANGEITVDIRSKKYLESIVGHEVTHVLEKTEFYKPMQEAIFEYAKSKGEYETRLKKLQDLYNGVEGANVEAELTADLVGDYLFQDSDFINKLSTENRNVFQKIYDEIKHLLKLATAGSDQARKLEQVKYKFDQAWQELGKAEKNTADSGVKYSLHEFAQDGRRYVEIDQDQSRFEGHSIEEFPRIAKEIINEKFNGKAIGIDNKMFVNGAGRDEFANPSKRIPDDVYETKMRTAGELDNLLDAGANFRNAPDGADGHIHKDVIGGFDYFDTLFKIGDRYYEAVINIKNVKRGKLFKDVTKIKDVTQDIMSSYGENPKSQFLRTSSTDIVSTEGEKVNPKFSISDTAGRQLSEEQAEYLKDSKVRDENGNLKVMYHGTPNGDFTVFKDGTYFTDDKAYADRYQNPGASSISTGKTASNPKTFEVYLDIKKPFDLSDPEAKRIYIEDYIKGGNAMGINPYLSDAEYAKIKTIDWTEGEDLRDFLTENGYDYDGLVLDEGADGGYGDAVQSRGTSYVVFSPEQVKSVDNQSPTSDPDIRFSLSETVEETPKRYGDRATLGSEIAYAQEDIAPVAENATTVSNTESVAPVAISKIETTTEDLFPDDTAPIQEEYEYLLAEREDIKGAMDAFAAVGNYAGAEQLMAEYEAVQKRIAEIEADDTDRLASIDEADVPPEVDNTPEDVADNVPLTKALVTELAKQVKGQLGLGNNRTAEVRELIERYSNEEFPSKAHLYTEIQERFGTYTETQVDEDLKGIKSLLRTYGINVDESIKGEIADYGQLMRSNFGKVRFSKEGLPVDVAYKEFQEVLPGYFPESIYVPTDQLMRIIEVANMDTTMETEYEIDWQTLEDVTDTIMNRVAEFKQNRKEALANRHGRESFNSLMEEADQYVPPIPKNVAPVRPAIQNVQAEPDDIAPVFETSSGQQSLMPEEEAQKKLTRKELHLNIMDNIKTMFRERGFEFDEVLKKAKDLSTFATVDNTPQRVMEKALGYKEGQVLSDLTVNQVAQNETEGIRWLNSFTDKKNGLLAKISKQYGIKPGSKASAAAQMYAEGFYVGENEAIIEYGDKELAADFPDRKVQENIKKLAKDPRIRQIYDETLAAINASRTRNAYPEIPRLDNYFLHFRAMEDTFSRLGLPFNPNDIRAKDLPTDLNGVTADLKPGQPYFASSKHRLGKRTSFDLLGGLEKYLTSAKNQIYHIDDIQTLRALRNYVAETYGQATGLRDLDLLSDEEAEQRIHDVYNSHLSTFAKFLNEEANVLAGKTSLIDRGLEGVIGRRGITFLDTLNKQVGANMVGFNVSSSLTNFIAPVQAFAKSNKADFVKAMAQTAYNKIGSIFGKGDGFTEESPVMIRRKGAERFYRTPYQKVADSGYVLMGVVDDISTELIARTKYNELTRKGMDSQQAHYETDKWVSRLMGDRSLGQQPQLYNSKMLGLFTKFQLEVRNQLDSQFYDTIQEAKVSAEEIENKLLRNAKKAAKITSTFAQLAVMQHVFGKAFESVAGYNPAFDIIEALIKAFGWDDEEDDEDTVLDNIEQGFMELMGDMPYVSTLTGGRIPISSALPIGELYKGEDQYGNEKSRWETLGEAAPYYLLPGGYGQIKKAKAGMEMFDEDLPIAGSYTDSGNLRFPVEDTTGNRLQAALFGQWASENARDYFDNKRKPLNEKQTQEFIDSDMPIRDYWDYREGLAEHEKLEDKADYIAGLDLPVSTKNMLVNNVSGRKENIDLTGYDEYSGLEELDFATKHPEKYEVAQAVGGYQQYMQYREDMQELKLAEKADYIAGLNLTTAQKNLLINSETDRKEPIDLTGYENFSNFEEFEFAKDYPEAYAMAKSVGGYESYKVYSEALGDIKADKDEFGNSISGTRKTKVTEYIYGLDIPDIEKHILFKSQYPSTDDYNYEIIDYLNGRSDMTFEEKIEALRKLDFDVDAAGNIYW